MLFKGLIASTLFALAAAEDGNDCDLEALMECAADITLDDNGIPADCAGWKTYGKCYAKTDGCKTDALCEALEEAAKEADCTAKCSCFPASATVELEGGLSKAIGDVQVGDKLHVGQGVYSEVYYFSTQMEDTSSKFVQIQTSNSTLLLTNGHYLYVNGVLAEARTVKVGDNLIQGDGYMSQVEKVSEAWAPGLYNPHTMHGDVVVNGILTSTYTDAVHPTLAHALLAPLRQLYATGLVSFGTPISEFTKGLPAWIRDTVRA